MKNLKVYVKNFSDVEWQDVTKSTLASKMSLRKGFSSLGKGSDVGKMSITFKADDLAAAAVFHTTAKQIRLVKAGRNIFEGYTEGSAKVRSTASSSLAWIQLSAYPYARLAESGKVAEDHTFFGHKILDPADPAHSLVHKLVDLVWSTVPEKYRSILPTLPEQKIITNLSITKVLPLMVIEADDKPLDILDDLLAEYGIARYMENLQMVLLEPYAIDSRVPYALEYNDILSEPSIKSAPFVVTKKCVVNLGKVAEKGPETVYMLDDDDGAEGWAEEFIPHGGVWPKDQDVMEASYGTASEAEDLKLFYSSGLSYELKTTEGADIRAEKANLQGTRAEFKFKNYGSSDAYIWQIKVNAERTFYRDYSYVTQDEELKAEETEDIDSIYMVDADDAAHYIRTYRAEKKAESQRISISSGKIIFSPGDLITLGNIPYTILVRYVEDNILTGQMKAECVVYDVREIATTGKVQSGSAIGGGISYITLALSGSAYRYKSDGTLSDFSEASITATVKRYGTMETPRWYVNGLEVVGASGTSLDVPPSYMEGRSYITIEVTVGRFKASGYIYRINDGSSPIIQYRYSDSNTEPPLVSGGIWLFRGMPFFFKGTAFGELDSFNWSPNPLPLEGAPYKWMRTSTDGGETWVYSCITGKDGEPAKNFSIMAEQTTYPLSSRGVMLEDTTRRIFIDRQNLPQTEVCTWAVTPAALQPEVVVGDSITITIPKGSNYTSITVQANIASFGARTLLLSGVRAGDPHAEYWGDKFTLEQIEAMETTPNGEPWVNGDHAVIVVNSEPIPYVYEMATKSWKPAQGTETNFSQIFGSMLYDIVHSPAAGMTNAAIYGFFENFASVHGLIRNLVAENLKVMNADKADPDVGLYVHVATVGEGGLPVFVIKYDGRTLFQVAPNNGNIFFGEPMPDLTAPRTGFMYTPVKPDGSGGIITCANGNVEIRQDGTIETKNMMSIGMQCDYATIKDGTFKGKFDCASIYTEAEAMRHEDKTFTTGKGAARAFIAQYYASLIPGERDLSDKIINDTGYLRCQLIGGDSRVAFMRVRVEIAEASIWNATYDLFSVKFYDGNLKEVSMSGTERELSPGSWPSEFTRGSSFPGAQDKYHYESRSSSYRISFWDMPDWSAYSEGWEYYPNSGFTVRLLFGGNNLMMSVPIAPGSSEIGGYNKGRVYCDASGYLKIKN